MSAVNLMSDLAADLGIDLESMRWMDNARCAEVDPEIFYPEKGQATRAAKNVCRWCEVREACLEYALSHPEVSRFGVWAGTSPYQREIIRAQRNGSAA